MDVQREEELGAFRTVLSAAPHRGLKAAQGQIAVLDEPIRA